MDPLNVQTISEAYFASLNEHRGQHIVRDRTATGDDIEQDLTLWYEGFTACARLIEGKPVLPSLGPVSEVVTKNFANRIKVAA
jgi:hypothetical protein